VESGEITAAILLPDSPFPTMISLPQQASPVIGVDQRQKGEIRILEWPGGYLLIGGGRFGNENVSTLYSSTGTPRRKNSGERDDV